MTRLGPTPHVHRAILVPFGLLASALAATALAPSHGDLSAQPGDRAYAASAHGGNYMHNFYFPPAPSSTPWYPTWHPGGERVAVAMSGFDLGRVHSDTGRE